MANDLFFSLPVTQNKIPGIYKSKIASSDSGPSAKIKTKKQQPKAEGESFLKIFQKVSQKPSRAEKSHNTHRTKPSETKTEMPEDKMDETLNPAADQSEGEEELALLQENTATAESDQLVSIQNFMALIKTLEEVGYHISDGGSDGQNWVDADSTDGKDVAVLKILMTGLQHSRMVSSTELKAAFEQLKQFIANALKGITPAVVEENTSTGQVLDQVPNSARILQWIQELAAGPQYQSNDVQMNADEGEPVGKLSEAAVTDTKSIVGATANSIAVTGNSAGNSEGDGAFRANENAGVTSPIENRGAMEPATRTSENFPAQTQINENSKEAAAVEKEKADTSRPKEEVSFLRETKTDSRVNSSQPMPAGQDRMLSNKPEKIPDNQPVKQPGPSESNMESDKVSNGLKPATAGEASLSKLLPEDRSIKDGNVKVSSGMSEQTGGKVIKTEAGANDSGLLNSQNHQMAKTAEASSLPKAIESEPNGLKNQALDQIVHKAALHLKNGQHEARIDLKPELLGHIRMQVISENHQVTVRIVAEHGFVKDMIENNVHQLKTNLQHQGLDIDKLEVSVSRDSDESGTPKERSAGTRARQPAADNRNQRHLGQDTPRDNRQPRRNTRGMTAVDYFA
jgi:flagellar hook-length control protein FliK